MASGCCSDQGETKIVPGDGIEVKGSGSPSNPFRIGVRLPDFTKILRVRDSPTLNLTLLGSGVPEDPFEISGTAAQRIDQASDFSDPQGPAQGDTLVYVGTGADGHWEAAPPPPSPPGAVNVGEGLQGTGAAGSPLRVRTSGVATGDGLDGGEIYVDVTGALRYRRGSGGTVGEIGWDDVGDKPSAFTPIRHTHPADEITDQSKLNAGFVNGIKLYSQQSQPPVGPAGTLWASW